MISQSRTHEPKIKRHLIPPETNFLLTTCGEACSCKDYSSAPKVYVREIFGFLLQDRTIDTGAGGICWVHVHPPVLQDGRISRWLVNCSFSCGKTKAEQGTSNMKAEDSIWLQCKNSHNKGACVNRKFDLQALIFIGWVLALGIHYTLVFGMYPFHRDGRISMSTEMDALYNATHRTVWAVSLGWIVFACANGMGGAYRTRNG